MTSPLVFIKQLENQTFQDEDGHTHQWILTPPMSQEELADLIQALPCPIPEEIYQLLLYSRGFDESPLESVGFGGLPNMIGFFDEIFPCALPIAHDGFGNYWVLDLTETATSWSPIFFVCHDPPVIVYQTDSFVHFLQELVKLGEPPFTSELDTVHEELSVRIWKENPGTITVEEALVSPDETLREFAQTLEPNYLIVDLRQARMGEGFSWGRFGPKTPLRRHGQTRLFAYQHKTFWERLLGK